MEAFSGSSTFIVRLSRDHEGHLTGIVERVRTGQKERFQGLDHIGEVIGRMVAGAATNPPMMPRQHRAPNTSQLASGPEEVTP